MTDKEKELEKEAQQIIQDLAESLRKKDMVVTGQTLASIRSEVGKTGFSIFGADYIQALETGRGPYAGGPEDPDFLTRLEIWARLKGVNIPPRTLKYMLNRFGSRLFRGVDPRFPGRSSGVFSDVINPGLTERLSRKFGLVFSGLFETDIENEFKDKIKINF